MKKHELKITPEGIVISMYADELLEVLQELGQLRITRASHIEFDGEIQAWGVWDRTGKDTGQRFKTREAALAWERDNFWSLI